MRLVNRLALVVMMGYAALVLLPSSIWYEPGVPVFRDAQLGESPDVEFFREIKIASSIKYSVIVRVVGTNDVVCDAVGGPFTYKPTLGPLKDKDLAWWAPSDPRCSMLPVGEYWAETTWTIVNPIGELLPDILRPIGSLVPSKRVTQIGPPFSITSIE
ncbi:MAG: hypothetical protein WBC93_06250 [Sulfitobacter sp.]